MNRVKAAAVSNSSGVGLARVRVGDAEVMVAVVVVVVVVAEVVAEVGSLVARRGKSSAGARTSGSLSSNASCN